MKKIVQINTTCGAGSTGKICVAVSRLLTEQGIENFVFYTHGSSDYSLGVHFGTPAYKKAQALRSRVLGNYGFNSQRITRQMIAELERIRPDAVHLHNIHGHDCDLNLLFSYFKSRKIKLFWTFHDCWAFTGYCPHFDMIGCGRWQTGCGRCPQKRESSWFFDRSKTLYKRKKKLLDGLDLTVITPSQWLGDLVKQSFLGDYPVRVIHNGIDLSLFRPIPGDVRKRYGLEGKNVLLGVAFGWDKRKGLDVFTELASRLDDSYRIVLVGTDESVDRQLPKSIIAIHRTKNQAELAELYTAADLLINPTREENYPTVNMEALACGTPVVTFRTGGSPEIIDPTCGSAVPKNDVDALEQEIIRVCTHRPYSAEACLARAQSFDQRERFLEYISLYED